MREHKLLAKWERDTATGRLACTWHLVDETEQDTEKTDKVPVLKATWSKDKDGKLFSTWDVM